jgi:hypothetical protein
MWYEYLKRLERENNRRAASPLLNAPASPRISDRYFTQRRKDRKDAKAGQILRASLCVLAIFAALCELYLDASLLLDLIHGGSFEFCDGFDQSTTLKRIPKREPDELSPLLK